MKIFNIMKLMPGDILTYRNGQEHYVNKNKLDNYRHFYKKDFRHKYNSEIDIMKIQRYTKILFFYILKTIYRR